MVERALSDAAAIRLRAVREDDHRTFTRLVDEWWGERRPRVPRLWFRHFAGLGWIAERADGRDVGIALGGLGHDRPALGLLVVVAVAPYVRRQGIGRSLVDAVGGSLRSAGAGTVEATVWPGNRVGVRFLEGLGFAASPEATVPLYGVPAVADFDGEGEDRAVFERRL